MQSSQKQSQYILIVDYENLVYTKWPTSELILDTNHNSSEDFKRFIVIMIEASFVSGIMKWVE